MKVPGKPRRVLASVAEDRHQRAEHRDREQQQRAGERDHGGDQPVAQLPRPGLRTLELLLRVGDLGLDIAESPRHLLQLVERFSLADPETLLYRYTITDPTTWTKPFTVEIPMSRSDEHIYEYACHEGNYGMQGILTGARLDDKK